MFWEDYVTCYTIWEGVLCLIRTSVNTEFLVCWYDLLPSNHQVRTKVECLQGQCHDFRSYYTFFWVNLIVHIVSPRVDILFDLGTHQKVNNAWLSSGHLTLPSWPRYPRLRVTVCVSDMSWSRICQAINLCLLACCFCMMAGLVASDA